MLKVILAGGRESGRESDLYRSKYMKQTSMKIKSNFRINLCRIMHRVDMFMTA
jgi:hypothetical protein